MNGNTEQKGQTTRKTIAEIFGGGKEPNEKRLSIPNYQRDYAWEPKNFEDLWSDLQDAMKHPGEEGHFLNTLIVAPNGDKFDLIDGQQRMTTSFMLLYVLAHRSESNENMGLLEKNGELKLEVAEGNREFFREILENSKNGHLDSCFGKPEKADTQGKEKLYQVLNMILAKVESLNEEQKEQTDKYLKNLLSMYVIWHEETNPNRAIRVFHTINDRGVPLKLLDKLKALLMRYSYQHCGGELDDSINQAFGEIFKISAKINKHKYVSKMGLGKSLEAKENAIFWYHARSKKFNENFLGSIGLSTEETYSKVVNALKDFKDSKLNLEKFIKEYTEDLRDFYQGFLALLDDIDKDIDVFKLLVLERPNEYFYNTLVRIKMDIKGNKFNRRILELIAKADILFYQLGTNDRKAPAYNLIEPYLLDGEAGLIKAIIGKCREIDVLGVAIKDIERNAYYRDFFHYVFFEQHSKENQSMTFDELKKLFNQEKIQMEHIVPQDAKVKNKKEEYRDKAKEWGFQHIDDLWDYIHYYGNLSSLERPRNIAASNNDLPNKAEEYQKSQIPCVEKFGYELKAQDNSNRKELIDKRNEEFRKWAETEFFKEFK